jgi:hypothetical protein
VPSFVVYFFLTIIFNPFQTQDFELYPLCIQLDSFIFFYRLALHSSRLHLRHPVTHEPLELYSELPNDIASLLEVLREQGARTHTNSAALQNQESASE